MSITKKDVKKAGSLAKVYQKKANKGDERAKEVTQRVAKSNMQARQNKAQAKAEAEGGVLGMIAIRNKLIKESIE